MRRWQKIALAAAAAPFAAGGLAMAGVVAWLESGSSRPIEREIRDYTELVRIEADHVARPRNVETIQRLLARHDGPVSIGGGRYSMGGQIGTDGTVFLDLREFDDVIHLDPAARRVVVEAGITWRALIEALDPHDLSVKIMQSYANFTVGGTLSVNAHGRYVGEGAVVHSVAWFTLVKPDGTVVRCSRDANPGLFHAVIGGYGAFGVIAHVALDLTENRPLARTVAFLPTKDFLPWFDRTVRPATDVVMFNADLYPPDYDDLVAITFSETDREVTEPERIQPPGGSSRVDKLLYWWVSQGPKGKEARQALLDPVRLASDPVVWRNWEASYDVAGLDAGSKDERTYVLQEYFLPVDRFDAFVPKMREVFEKWDVNVVNVSIRHAEPDPDTWLTWSPQETFAFVVFYQQGTSDAEQAEVGEWTREMLDAVIAEGGRYYLPYQPHATLEQLRAAYPRVDEWWALKRQVDPEYRIRNRFLETYFPPEPEGDEAAARAVVEARPTWRRPEDQTFLTLPEWYVVYSADELGQFLAAHRAHEFPYFAAIRQFWTLYRQVWHLTRERYTFNSGYHAMIAVVATSITAEYTVRGLYEHSLGRWFGAGDRSPEEDLHAEVTADYGAFTHHTPWFGYPFAADQERLASTPSGGTWRATERRFVVGTELWAKRLWAAPVAAAAGAAYAPEPTVVEAWVRPRGIPLDVPGVSVIAELPGGDVLIGLPRYEPFTAAVVALAERGVEFVEIAGGDTLVVQVRASTQWSQAELWGDVVHRWPMLSEPATARWALEVPVRRLDEVLPELAAAGTIERLYDF